ncbi:4593_t:CDS:2 [Funneliformis mosseae]|uniref:4593_t:CDS:1 n=1 Tax=Funneliformis mosseae TaxID=27381 RepID=A0A9N8V1Z6_FUNMO|nr:4593_t:CDS:2 [Funneliformis mosseae]
MNNIVKYKFYEFSTTIEEIRNELNDAKERLGKAKEDLKEWKKEENNRELLKRLRIKAISGELSEGEKKERKRLEEELKELKKNRDENLDFTEVNVKNDEKTFSKEKWNRKVILFFDEFDRIYDAPDGINDDCLGAIRSLKNTRNHVIHSVIAAKEVTHLYQNYSSSRKINIDTSIISDIYNKTNGYAGFVCLCGRAIDEDLICGIDETRSLHLDSWIIYCSNELQNRIIQYLTFTKMISTLKKSKASMDLLQSQFMFDLEFHNVTLSDINFANFLAAEGALHPYEKYSAKFKISSPLICTLILQCVIPSVYSDRLKVDLPYQDEIFVTINALKEVVRVFDQGVISLGFQQSFKTAKNYVNDKKNQHVLWESVYDQEFFRIFSNWLIPNGFSISGQWHLIEEYAEKLKANEAWVVHFTCADNVIEKPIWPIEQEQKDKLYIVHFWHDISFKSVQMTARFLNGEIINEIVIS